jgi:orotate phosphoribosyltransferase-like protein
MGNLSKIKNLLKKDQRGLNIREISERLDINRNSVAKLLDIPQKKKLSSGFMDVQKYIA